MAELRILPVTGIGDIEPGADLAAVITHAAPWLADGDVLVVTSKIVSKAEGRLLAVPPEGPEREAARVAALLAETARPVARRGPTRIVQTHHGLVMASAGIDASNVDSAHLVLLPVDPDASARSLRAALRHRYGLDVAVVITDTMGRPWRLGLVDVAIGAAGIEPVADYRGQLDAYGNELHITQTAVIDELAGAAELVKGKHDQVPVAVVRGLDSAIGARTGDGPGAAALVRSADTDMFSLGTDEARALGLRESATLVDVDAFAEVELDAAPGGLDATLAGTAFARVTEERALDKLCGLVPANAVAVVVPSAADEPWAMAQAGAAVQRLRAVLAADGWASAWVRADPVALADIVAVPQGVPLGLLAIGAPPPAS